MSGLFLNVRVSKQIHYHGNLGWYKGKAVKLPSGAGRFLRGASGCDALLQMRRASARIPTPFSDLNLSVLRLHLHVWDFLWKNGLHAQKHCHLMLGDLLPIYPSGLCKIYACDKPVSQTATNSDKCQPDPLYSHIYKGILDMTVSNCCLHVNTQIMFFNWK